MQSCRLRHSLVRISSQRSLRVRQVGKLAFDEAVGEAKAISTVLGLGPFDWICDSHLYQGRKCQHGPHVFGT